MHFRLFRLSLWLCDAGTTNFTSLNNSLLNINLVLSLIFGRLVCQLWSNERKEAIAPSKNLQSDLRFRSDLVPRLRLTVLNNVLRMSVTSLVYLPKHRGKTSTHAPGWTFPVSFSVTLSSQIKVSRARSDSFCVQLVVQLFCFMLLVFWLFCSYWNCFYG